jgi:transketolase
VPDEVTAPGPLPPGKTPGARVLANKSSETFKGTPASSMPSFVAGEELAKLAEADPRVVVLTADLAGPNRLSEFAARHPHRFFNVGIAEKNMISMAAGLATTGFIPFAATFASFAVLTGCEQIRTDCAYTGLPVRVIGHHAGMALGYYGSSHHALEDLGICRTIAGLTTVCATDASLLRAILQASLDYPAPVYIRIGRGRDPQVYPTVPADFQFGRARRLAEGPDLTIIATGSEVAPSIRAAAQLSSEGIQARVVDMCTVQPLDRDEVLRAAAETGGILTVEEHNVTGGLGTAVAEVLADAGVSTRLVRLGVPDQYVEIGPPRALYAHYHLDAAGIAAATRTLVGAAPPGTAG